jgi:glycosyltransferase involved in cell wall biosynthesis
LASGEFVAFLDSDDRWYPEFLSTQLRVLDSDESIGVATSDFDFIDENGAVTNASSGNYEPSTGMLDSLVEYDTEQIFQDLYIAPSTVLMRRRIFDAITPFNEGLEACEDYDLWMRISTICRIVETPIVLASYRSHGKQLTSDENRIVVSRYKAFKEAISSCPEIRLRVNRKLFNRRMANLAMRAAGYYRWVNRNAAVARKLYLETLSHEPGNLEAIYQALICSLPGGLLAKAPKLKSFVHATFSRLIKGK